MKDKKTITRKPKGSWPLVTPEYVRQQYLLWKSEPEKVEESMREVFNYISSTRQYENLDKFLDHCMIERWLRQSRVLC
jgi:hypothetical protein